jgi:anthranilate synthase component 1
MLQPAFDVFEKAWAEGRNQIVWARLAADLDTPVSLMLKLGEARADTFMLESVTGGEVRGRYSIVGMKPDLIWRCRGTQSASTARPASTGPPSPAGRPSADTLRALIGECRIDLPEGLPAASAGCSAISAMT